LLAVCADDTTVLPQCALEQYGDRAEIVMLPKGGHACWPLTPLWSAIDGFIDRTVVA